MSSWKPGSLCLRPAILSLFCMWKHQGTWGTLAPVFSKFPNKANVWTHLNISAFQIPPLVWILRRHWEVLHKLKCQLRMGLFHNSFVLCQHWPIVTGSELADPKILHLQSVKIVRQTVKSHAKPWIQCSKRIRSVEVSPHLLGATILAYCLKSSLLKTLSRTRGD
jgi:hypothetical protein